MEIADKKEKEIEASTPAAEREGDDRERQARDQQSGFHPLKVLGLGFLS